MRYKRVITPVSFLVLLTACTGTPSFDPTPRPSRPGQVVVIAGSPQNHEPPRDGEYAVESSARSEGGLAIDAGNGVIYLRVLGGGDKPVERIERDGTLTVLRPKAPGDQLGFTPGTLWIMSSYKGLRLTKMSLSNLSETKVLDSDEGPAIQVLGPSGSPLRERRQATLRKSLAGARFVVRGDDIPVIVSQAGDLYEVAGPDKIKQWRPQGYPEAMHGLVGDADLRPASAVPLGGRGLLLVAPTGLLRITDDRAQGIRIHMRAGGLPDWSAVLPLEDGSALLLGGTSAVEPSPRPGLVRPDGRLEVLSYGKRQICDDFDGSMAVLASADPVGMGRMKNGDYVVVDQACSRTYRVRLPSSFAGVPHTR